MKPCSDYDLHYPAPQAHRNLMPQIGNNLIINIKDSCVLLLLVWQNCCIKTKAAAGALYMNFETYTITMIHVFYHDIYLLQTAASVGEEDGWCR